MKTFAFVACLLTVAYTADPESVKDFHQKYRECTTEFGVPSGQIDARVMKCVGKKANIYNKEGIIKIDILFAYCEKLFITGSVEKGKEIMLKCLNEDYRGPGNNYKKAIAFIECCIKQNIMDLIPEE